MAQVKTTGLHWIVRTAEQQGNLMQVLHDFPLPYMVKVGQVQHPKTTQQIRYAHSLCNALAAAKQVSPVLAKRDAKVAFGVIKVHHSVITGDRTARLESFAEYSREEMEGFLTAMEVHLSEQGIEYTPAGDTE